MGRISKRGRRQPHVCGNCTVALLIVGGLVLFAVVLIPLVLSPSEHNAFSSSVSSEGGFLKDSYNGAIEHKARAAFGKIHIGKRAPSTLASAHHAKHASPASSPASSYFAVFSDVSEGSANGIEDEFATLPDNKMNRVKEDPVSTFSADVDTSSYSYIRRALQEGLLPQASAVRAEEMINYFDYDYPLPKSKDHPLEAIVDVSDSPWNEGRMLIHIGIVGYDIKPSEKRRSNLVFLLDVSGSMGMSDDRLPLVKKSVELLLGSLDSEDHVSIVSYSHEAQVELDPTPVRKKGTILNVLRRLTAGGGTGGAGGLELAYKLAERNFDDGAVNRILLASDGDFNVGVTDNDRLRSFIEKKRDKGIFLSVLGFGVGNYKDSRMKVLANHGNGVAMYIDTIHEAQKVLVDESRSTIFPIAKDVKIQVEFNPAAISEYRLIGFEKRLLDREDFNNDKVDAGDIGSGHTVTAIYEVTPVRSDSNLLDELRYSPAQDSTHPALSAKKAAEYAFLKIRYKLPDEKDSKLFKMPIYQSDSIPSATGTAVARHSSASAFRGRLLSGALVKEEFAFATAVASFAQLLKGGKHMGSFGYDDVTSLAEMNKGPDVHGYRGEFIELVSRAKTLATKYVV